MALITSCQASFQNVAGYEGILLLFRKMCVSAIRRFQNPQNRSDSLSVKNTSHALK